MEYKQIQGLTVPVCTEVAGQLDCVYDEEGIYVRYFPEVSHGRQVKLIEKS